MGIRKRSSLVKKWCLRYMVMVLIALLALLSVATYFKNDYERLALQTIKGRLEATVEFYSRILDAGLPLLYIASEIEELSVNQFYTATLYDRKGEIVFSDGLDTGHVEVPFRLMETGEIVKVAGGERLIRMDRKLLRGDEWLATLRFTTSLRLLDQKYKEFVIGLSVVVFGLTVTMVFASYIFMRSMVRPLIEMKNIAEIYAKGNFDADISISRNDEIGQLAETMQLMARDLKHMDDAKYQFIDTVSHELRTPMTAILGWCDLMEMRPELSDKGIQMIKIETQRLGDLVSNLMAFNVMKITQDLKLSQFDLVELLEEVLLVFKPRMNRYDMVTETNWSVDKLAIVSDRGKLKQVIVNILDNAMKFSDQGTTIRIDQEIIDSGFKLIISDQGSGILPQHLEQLTQKYFRGATDKPGMGLGLAIVKDLMQALGGEFYIESQVGVGTRVTIIMKQLSAENPDQVVKI